jgi:hypothetical protein
VIPLDYITEWRQVAPWAQDAQVEQDLVISRALVHLFQQEELSRLLAFRGGTALYKLYSLLLPGIQRTLTLCKCFPARLDLSSTRCAARWIPG